MKEKILEMRAEGKTYNEIQQALGCSKSTISYHCGKGQKDKTKARQKKNRAADVNRPIKYRVESFLSKEAKSKLRHGTYDFARGSKRDSNAKPLFTYNDVIEKFGIETQCYLTGRPINLTEGDYHFDHVIPIAQGGSNELDNLGIACSIANVSKNALTVEEYLDLCKEVLTHHGYTITK